MSTKDDHLSTNLMYSHLLKLDRLHPKTNTPLHHDLLNESPTVEIGIQMPLLLIRPAILLTNCISKHFITRLQRFNTCIIPAVNST